MITKLTCPPISWEYEEIIFDLPWPWKMTSWNYLLFTQESWNQWCGHFREEDMHNFKVAEIKSKGIACVVSWWHWYLIDIEKKEKIKDLENNMLVDAYGDQKTNIFYIASDRSIYCIDSNLLEQEIDLPFAADGIKFIKENNRKLTIDTFIIWESNSNYYIDLEKRCVNKKLPKFK